jgi:hypothetical protein
MPRPDSGARWDGGVGCMRASLRCLALRASRRPSPTAGRCSTQATSGSRTPATRQQLHALRIETAVPARTVGCAPGNRRVHSLSWRGHLRVCHGPTARPPMPPVAGGAGGGRRIVLEASDGNRFAAFSATTEIVDAPGVVILPDIRGLHPFYEELGTSVRRCRRARAGPGLLRPDGRDRAPRRRLRPQAAPPTSQR